MEENEDSRKMIESMRKGSDAEMERSLQNYRKAGSDVLGWDHERVETMERGLRWAVEARRKRRETERKPTTGTEGLARGGDDRRQTDETSGKGKGKGNGGKGEHGSKKDWEGKEHSRTPGRHNMKMRRTRRSTGRIDDDERRRTGGRK